MINNIKKTKIVCTLGPASENEETLRELIKNGLNVCRLNFSHGSHEEHKGRMDLVKKLREELNMPTAILLDTKGPEIRTGKFDVPEVFLEEGQTFTITMKDVIGDKERCTVSYKGLANDVKPGDTILIDDGLVGLTVKEVNNDDIVCEVQNSGIVKNHKGVNVPGVKVNLPAITEKDRSDIEFGIEQGIDFIAASFVRKVSDVLAIREILEENNAEHIKIISKIENQEGVENLDEIIEVSDGIMVARGDLGVEIPTEEIPVVQKLMIKKCNEAGKPVITATQMLDSMIRNPRPTRAEVSDVANAILDGTDAIMLSGESANGDWPVESVQTMARIATETEEQLKYETAVSKAKSHTPAISGVISRAACNAANELKAAAIVSSTKSGATARRISQCRPECPIVAVTPSEKVAKSLAFCFGVYPVVAEDQNSTDAMMANATKIAVENGFAKAGDTVVIAAGLDKVGSTNLLKVSVVE